MSRVTRAWLGVASLIVLLHLAMAANAQQSTPGHQEPAAKSQSEMSAKCQEMMAQHDKMMTEMKAADQRLDSLVAKMNAASGQEKIDATAAVVTELVAQRKTMRERMMSRNHHMMGHMAEHMQAGPQSMAMCPMMKMDGKKH